MPWLRSGDTAAMYPKLLSVVASANFDDRLINEVAGFLWRCGTQAAGYLTDYVVDLGTAYSLAGSRVSVLTDACVQAGLMEPVDMNGVRGWKLIEDPEFLHMKTEEEISWEKQRKADNGNPALIIPVRRRDGDACRYCGKIVKWTARKGKLAGTYDHREPGQAATVATLVVCCGECNAKRGNDTDADNRVPLLPEPTPPYFDKSTIEWLNSSSWAKDNGLPPIPPKRDKFVPVGAVPPGHESHVSVATELLLESPVETSHDSQSVVDGPGVDSQTVPELPAWLGDPVTSTPAPDHQSGRDDLEADLTDEVPVSLSSISTATAVPGSVAPASSGRAASSRAASTEGTDATAVPGSVAPASSGRAASSRAASPVPARQRDSAPPAEKVDLPKKSDPAGRECAGSGNAGAGRDGAGWVGNGEVRDGDGSADGDQEVSGFGKRRRRRGKRKGR